MGEAILDEGQPSLGAIDQIEPAGNRRAVPIDADHPGTADAKDGAAIAAGSEGRVDIGSPLTGVEHLDRLATEHGNMASANRIHAPAPASWRSMRKLDANEPIAPQIPVFCLSDEPRSADPTRAPGQTPVRACNLLGCHRAFEREKGGRPPPKAGSALHRSVTASSVKKTMMGLLHFVRRQAPARPLTASDASRTHPGKIVAEATRSIAPPLP